jgi:divalent metal cation (Fe/Co/Zn/Cd) transporter
MLLSGEHPDASAMGIFIAVLSLVVMPPLRQAKSKVGEQLASSAVKREGRENMMCAYLSICLLTGLGLNAVLGWWWADPVSAYGVAAIAAVAGSRAWRGVSCCAAPCCATSSEQLSGGVSN